MYVPYQQDTDIAFLLRINNTTVVSPQIAQICQERIKNVPYFEAGEMLEIVSGFS